VLIASSEKARRVLGWTPKHSAIDEIVQTAFAWHRKDDAARG
jgi:UDP-glucose 4-epimerase